MTYSPIRGIYPVMPALMRGAGLTVLLVCTPASAVDQQQRTAAQQEQINNAIATQLQLQQAQIQIQQMHAQREQDQQRLQMEIRLQQQQLQQRAEQDRLQLQIDRMRR